MRNLPLLLKKHLPVVVALPESESGDFGPCFFMLQFNRAWRRIQGKPCSAFCSTPSSPPTSFGTRMQNRAFSLAPMEIWKAIPGYEGQYEVSDQGRVKSYRRDHEGRFLRPGRMPGGHLSVALGRGNSQCVHKLVLLAFVGPAPDKHECCHNNGNPADNRLENLRWGTRRENILDAVRHGTWMTPERKAAADRGRAARWGHT
jgi:hypothetical protein